MENPHQIIGAVLAWMDKYQDQIGDEAGDELCDMLVTCEMILTMHGVHYEPVLD